MQSSDPKMQPHGFFMPHDSESAKSPIRTFDLPCWETRVPPKGPQFPGLNNLSGNHNNVDNFSGPSGLFPGGWKVDNPGPDMAPEQPTPPSIHTPSGLTPSDSLNDSSATSHSSNQDGARNNERATENPNIFSFPSPGQTSNANEQARSSSHDRNSVYLYGMPNTRSSNNDAFTVPPGWDLGTGNTPLAPEGSTFPVGNTPLPSGMSPPADGDWSQLLGSMGWSATGPPQGNMDWANAEASSQYGYKYGFLIDTESQGK